MRVQYERAVIADIVQGKYLLIPYCQRVAFFVCGYFAVNYRLSLGYPSVEDDSFIEYN